MTGMLHHCHLSLTCQEATRLPGKAFSGLSALVCQEKGTQDEEEALCLQCPQRFQWVDLLEVDCPACGQRIYFWQGVDVGRHPRRGPLCRIQKPARIQAWLQAKRMYLASIKGSAWVWGSRAEFPYTLRRRAL